MHVSGRIIIIPISYRVISYFNMGSYFQVNFTAQPYFVPRVLFLPRSESEAGVGWREDGGSEGSEKKELVRRGFDEDRQ